MTLSAISENSPRLSVIETVARQYHMEAGPFERTLRATVIPEKCSREEFAAFLLVAKNYGLNPILREIYAFPKKGGGIQPIVGIDGWTAMINREPAFDGMSFADHMDDDGKLIAITCRMHRKDRAHPIEATEYMAECNRGTETWTKWPRRMLRHKAVIQCARYAFGFSDIVDPDEYDRFGATPHDPAMLQAQMQIVHENIRDGDRLGDGPHGDEIDREDRDYLTGRRDYRAHRVRPHEEIDNDDARREKWLAGWNDARDEGDGA